MRWQPLSISECIEHGDWRAVWSRLAPSSGLVAGVVAAAAVVFIALPVSVRAEEVVDGGEVSFSSELPERGMPASNPRVKPLLSGHPNEFVTICVAGCDKPRIVQTLPKPREKRIGAMRTTAGGDAAPPAPSYEAIDKDAVICVGGCSGRTGQVLQRLPELPRVKTEPPRKSEPPPNEPLDVR